VCKPWEYIRRHHQIGELKMKFEQILNEGDFQVEEIRQSIVCIDRK